MGAWKSIIVIALFALAATARLFSQNPPAERGIGALDTLANRPIRLPTSLDTTKHVVSETTRVFYDSLEVRSGRKGLSKLIYEALFTDPNRGSARNKQVVDEAHVLKRFEGKTINSVAMDRHDVFEDKSNWFRSFAKGTHVVTSETAIRRDLLFAEGETFDAERVVASNQLLQGRYYIADSWIDVKMCPDDTTQVDILVTTLDSWTIGLDGELFRKDKRAMFYIYDMNFLGQGNRWGLKTYMQYNPWDYGGNIIDYNNPNFLGTFYTADLRVGKDFENRHLEAALGKEFILPTDYEAGISYADNRESRFHVYAPDTLARYLVRPKQFDLWGGWSKHIARLNSSFYLTTHISTSRFPVRPAETGPKMHPLFHNRDEIFFGTGFYWERFYTSTMIYGYGFQEYIASGHKLQLVGGYSWQEFGDYWYAGITADKGGFTGAGYLLGSVSIGSYINSRDGSLWMSAVDVKSQWISNLWGKRHGKVRQFVTLRYTKGWNRAEGAGALLRFHKEIRPVSFETYAAGSTRLLLNTETVVFTPFQPLGFRIALFGFADAGSIGRNSNPFRNEFFGTFGIGIRFKNERLVFSALQLRLGFAVGKKGLVDNKMFSAAPEQRITQHRFVPTRPQEVLYE